MLVHERYHPHSLLWPLLWLLFAGSSGFSGNLVSRYPHPAGDLQNWSHRMLDTAVQHPGTPQADARSTLPLHKLATATHH